MSQKTTTIADGILLEYSVEGYTITASDWNSTMETLKSAINNNAKVLGAVKPGTFQATIHGSQFVKEEGADPKAYSYIVYGTVHEVPVPFTVSVYNLSGQQIDNMAQIDFESGDVTLRTRVLEDVVLTIQGVGA